MKTSCKLLPALLLIFGGVVAADVHDSEMQPKTVIGPRNPDLRDGAHELMAGRAEEGIRLTERGLAAAIGQRERQAGLANLCAGYLMIEKYETALEYCDEALAENDRNWRALSNRALIYVKTGRYAEADADLKRGEALVPKAKSIKEVRGMYMDATEPVTPNIVIDDRRAGTADDDG